MMKKSLIILKGLLLTGIFSLLILCSSGIDVQAKKNKETTDVEVETWIHYNGTISGIETACNVRTGPGSSNPKLTDNGQAIQTRRDDKVLVLGAEESDDGSTWYHIRFTRDDKEYEGYVYGEYVTVDMENPITPTPIPEPEDEPEDTPLPTPSTAAIATKSPVSPTPIASSDNGSGNNNNDEPKSKKGILFVIFLVIAVAAVFFGLFIILGLVKQNKRKNRIRNARKVDRMRNSEQENGNGKRKPEIRRSDDDGAYVREVRQSVYYTNPEDEDEMYGIMPKETEDKRSLRAAVDRLQEHDIINHKVYGEGEVYDNSDVKLMEVRFGNDVRFLNKDSVVAKRLIEIIDDEDQALARRRSRRNRNKRNDY